MTGWSEVVRYPLGLAGFALFIVFKVYLHRSRSQSSGQGGASTLFLNFLATVALFGGLTVSILQATMPAFADIVRAILGFPQTPRVDISVLPTQQTGTSTSSLDGTWYLRVKTPNSFGAMVQKSALVIQGANAEIREGNTVWPAKWNLTGDVLTVRMANMGDPQMDTMLNSPYAAMISPLTGMPLTRKSDDLFESGPVPLDSTTLIYELFRTGR